MMMFRRKSDNPLPGVIVFIIGVVAAVIFSGYWLDHWFGPKPAPPTSAERDRVERAATTAVVRAQVAKGLEPGTLIVLAPLGDVMTVTFSKDGVAHVLHSHQDVDNPRPLDGSLIEDVDRIIAPNVEDPDYQAFAARFLKKS